MSTSRLQLRINSARVTVEDLRLATETVHNLAPEHRDWEGRAIAMVRLFPDDPDMALAVEHRLLAMSRLIASGRLPGWAKPEGLDGSTLVAESVWIAAATEPLILGEHEARFDEPSFIDRVLALAGAEGNA